MSTAVAMLSKGIELEKLTRGLQEGWQKDRKEEGRGEKGKEGGEVGGREVRRLVD